MQEESKQQAQVRSLRITDEVMAKFKAIQDENGMTHDTALKMLVNAYELEASKNAIPDRETEIANFQTKVNEITEAFLHSLQMNQDAEARARAEVSLQLKSKDDTIIDLQEKLSDLKDKNTTMRAEAEEAKAANKHLSEELLTAKSAEIEAKSALSDKETIIEMQKNQLADFEAIKKTAAADRQRAEDLRADVAKQKERADVAERALEASNAKNSALISEHNRELVHAKKEAETACRAAAIEAREEAQEKINSYIAKIEARDIEISNLKLELAELRAAKTEKKD